MRVHRERDVLRSAHLCAILGARLTRRRDALRVPHLVRAALRSAPAALRSAPAALRSARIELRSAHFRVSRQDDWVRGAGIVFHIIYLFVNHGLVHAVHYLCWPAVLSVLYYFPAHVSHDLMTKITVGLMCYSEPPVNGVVQDYLRGGIFEHGVVVGGALYSAPASFSLWCEINC